MIIKWKAEENKKDNIINWFFMTAWYIYTEKGKGEKSLKKALFKISDLSSSKRNNDDWTWVHAYSP